jgi:hypothetical protein
VTNATTTENTQTSSGLVIMPNALDTGFVTNFQITNITGGTLYLNDGVTQVTNGEFITVAQGASGLKFTPAANSTVSGSFSVQESSTNTVAGLGGPTATATITVNALPILAAPTSVSVNENSSLAFSGGNAISVTDTAGTGNNNETMTLTVQHGTLSLSTQTGLTVSGKGTTASPLKLSGPLSALNADLPSLVYTPAAKFSGMDSLSLGILDTTDQASGVPQQVTISVDAAPAFTSPNKVSFAVGVNWSFSLAASGYPASSFAITTGSLPQGLTLTPAGVLSGMPASGTAKQYPLTITASNGFGTNATQSFTLIVTATSSAPKITSANQATFTIGKSGKFTVKVSGSPTPTLSLTGTLPKGLTFDAATGLLSGKPGAGTAGTHTLTFTATNGIGTAASQTFTLTIDQVPAIKSAGTTTFVVAQNGKFTVKASGFPAPTFIESGSLPMGVTFNTTTGVLSGTPAAGTANSYSLTFTATNVAGNSAPQTFTLIVSNTAPAAAVARAASPTSSAAAVTATNGNSQIGPATAATMPVPATGDASPLKSAPTENAAENVLSGKVGPAVPGSRTSEGLSSICGRTDPIQKNQLLVNEAPDAAFSEGLAADNIETDLDNEASQWAGLSAALEILKV